ncbi:alpha/beta hydrolase [Streptomyces beihaiensis]|uniref:Lysophospholipase n=1 Tax=Streptomyces beihaiensis TaxID=2984495 RepID=A0ABT3TQD0_9ACTN|nr:alpha/beta fold hydrolase [Streptomyces beihaiensis]MCX3059207.1 lysophospholipase [Streptomyces beihaiensis]
MGSDDDEERIHVYAVGKRSPLVLRRTVPDARAAVLVLHGGRAQGMEAPSPWSLAAARMRPFTRALTRATAGQRVCVGEVRYRHRGWNGDRADAAQDAREAVTELVSRVGEVPVVLVGHSMGGRAALAVAGHPCVRSVVALAPWCPPREPVAHLGGRLVALVHGDRDRVTEAEASWRFAARAEAAGAVVWTVPVRGGGHAMVRRARAWHRLATALVVDGLVLTCAARPSDSATGT